MGQQEIDVRRATAGSPAAVWRLLGDSATWPDWTPIDVHERVEAPGPQGTDEVRRFRNGRVTVTERIVERVPERRLAYVLLAGLAVRDYRAAVDLTPDGTGTAIRWRTTFAAKVPGTGWLYRRALEKATRQFVDGLVAATAGAPGPATD